MNKDNRNRVKALRASVEELIKVLDAPMDVDPDDDKNRFVKGAVKTKKNAFVRSRYLLGKLQSVEGEYLRHKNEKWYSSTIRKLVGSADIAIDELSSVMTQKIDKAWGVDTKNSAIDAKQVAYDYIDEILAGSIELRGVLESIQSGEGVPSLKTSDFQVGLSEDHAYKGFHPPVKGKYKPGYNKDLDAVVISYDGTVGEIVEVFGLRIALPKAPPKSKLPNHRKRKHLQYWERPETSTELTPENAHLYADEIEEEFQRRDHGYWFYNNGEQTYITGSNYMLLTHYKTDADDNGHFHFRKAHRDLFLFLEAVWLDPRTLGTILGKTRRTGATYVAGAFLLTKGISTRDDIYGLTSKKDPDAKKVFQKIQHMFKHMPFFFKPLNTGEGLGKVLSFTTPSLRTTKKNQKEQAVYDDLNTEIGYQATDEDSYDSLKVKFYIGDELSKWKKGNILTHWSKIRKTLLTGNIVRGKAFLLSTVEYFTGKDPDEDGDAKSGDRFKKLFDESNLNNRDEFGSTKTGLYKVFISSLDNYEGFIDKYGNCISETPEKPIEGIDGGVVSVGVRQYLYSKWSKITNPSELNDERRKDPITEDDMFRVASKDSIFDVLKIQDQIDYNDDLHIAHGRQQYVVGDFKFADKLNRSGAYFEPNPLGRFKVKWLPDPVSEFANNMHTAGGLQSPANDYLGCVGIDPYKLNRAKYGTGSKGSIVGFFGDHGIAGIPQNDFVFSYIGKPPLLDIFFEDAMAVLVYYGMQGLIESNINELLVRMHKEGLTRYSMRRPDKLKLSFDERMYGGIPSTDVNLLMSQAAFLNRHIHLHIGYAEEGNPYREPGEIGSCAFNELLYDWLKFDITNRTKFDGTVASSLAVYGANKHLLRLKSKEGQKSLSVANFYSLY